MVRETIRGEWQPGWMERLRISIDGWSFWWRLTAWMGFVLLLPWLTSGLTVMTVRRRSNHASAFLVLGYTTVNLVLAAFLIGFTLSGFLPWLGFIGAVLFATAYPWWVCERIAAGERN